MEAFCKSCGRKTWFKIHIGVGSLIACIFTLGLWALAIPMYAQRCVMCGCCWHEPEKEKNTAKPSKEVPK
jgi:hypothetical protein